MGQGKQLCQLTKKDMAQESQNPKSLLNDEQNFYINRTYME
jgi:hypothetical protein